MNYRTQSDIWQVDRVFQNAQSATPTKQSRILAKFKQVFPLKLFPDDLIVEELRLVWVHRYGPWTDEVISIMASDIGSIDVSAGPLFGHVHIKNLTGGPEIYIDKLMRGSVYKIRCLVEGIALVARAGLRVENIDLNIKRNSLYQAGEVRFA